MRNIRVVLTCAFLGVPGFTHAANRYILYAATTTLNCTSNANGGKLTMAGADIFCADDVGITTTSAAGSYIQNQVAAQANSRFNVSTGAISGPLTVGGTITAGSGINVITTAAGLVDATKLTNLVPNTSIDGSSVTLKGNTFNGTSQLVQTNGSGQLPALSAVNLTAIPSANLSGLVPNANIDGSSVTLKGNSFNSGTQLLQLTSGLVPNANVDGSSVTLKGNTFNGNSQLVQTNSSGQLPALSATNLTAIPSANLSGLVPNANVDGSSVTKQGNTFNGNTQLVQTNSSGQLPALSATNLTSVPAGNLSGTVPNSTIDGSSITKQGNTFNGNTQLVQTNSSGQLPALSATNLTSIPAGNLTGTIAAISGANLTSLPAANLTGTIAAISGVNVTNLNGSNVTSGTVADTRLSANVALLNSSQTFSGNNTITKLVGVATNVSAASGNIGEVQSTQVNNIQPTTSGGWFDLTTKTLPAGDYLIWGQCFFEQGGAASTFTACGISVNSGNNGTGLLIGDTEMDTLPPTATCNVSANISPFEVSLSGSTAYYLKGKHGYTGSAPFDQGRLSWMRIH